jgi:hypothetical protein
VSIAATVVDLILDATAAGKAMLLAANASAQKALLSLVKADVGLDNVDNTSDAAKPVSTAQQTALDAKVTANTTIVGATKTKITYDSKGLVTVGADATTADIADSANRRYVTDAQQTVIGNTSGTNSGDNAVNTLYSGLVTNATHTGDATGATALTLATVNSNVGSFGSATQSAAVTVNAKGLVTAASATTITPAIGSVTGLGTGVGAALVTAVGSAGAPVVNGGSLGTPASGTLTNCTGYPTTGLGLTSGNLSQFAATTSLQLAGVISDETGSGSLVFANTPTLVTPVLGVATATSVNKVAITAPTTSATLTIANGATLTASATATVSGTNTGDNAVNALYSGLVTNATHTGDATGATALTLATVNANVGSFGSATQSVAFTVNAKGLVTAASATTITPAIGSVTGLGTGVGAALVTAIGSAGSPVLNGGALGTPASGVATNLTGTASGLTAGTVTTNANLTGDVTSVGNATTLANSGVTAGVYSMANIVVDAKGRITMAGNSSLGNSLVAIQNIPSMAADESIYYTSSTVAAAYSLTAAARTVLDDATVGDMVNTLGGATSTGTGGLVRLNAPTLQGGMLVEAGGNFTTNYGAPAQLRVRRAQGTQGAPAQATSGIQLGIIGAQGMNDALAFAGYTSYISFNAAQNITTTGCGGYFNFYTTPIGSLTEVMRTWVGAAGNFGIGVFAAEPSARLHVIHTTEQLRLAYDASNYLSATVGSTGAVTFDAVGAGAAFNFSDSVTVAGSLVSASGGVGYATGAGGTVTQATSKTTGVTLNKTTGTITMNAAAMTYNTKVAFTLTNSTIAATDFVLVQHESGGTVGYYFCTATPAAGSATINVYLEGFTAGTLSEAIVLRFVVIKSVNA